MGMASTGNPGANCHNQLFAGESGKAGLSNKSQVMPPPEKAAKGGADLADLEKAVIVPSSARWHCSTSRWLLAGVLAAVLLAAVAAVLLVVTPGTSGGGSAARSAASLAVPPSSTAQQLPQYTGNVTGVCASAASASLCEDTLKDDPRTKEAATLGDVMYLLVAAAQLQIKLFHQAVIAWKEAEATPGKLPDRADTLAMAMVDCDDMLEVCKRWLVHAVLGDLVTSEQCRGRRIIILKYDETLVMLSSAESSRGGCSDDLESFLKGPLPSSSPARNLTSLEAITKQAGAADRVLTNAMSLIAPLSDYQATQSSSPGGDSNSDADPFGADGGGDDAADLLSDDLAAADADDLLGGPSENATLGGVSRASSSARIIVVAKDGSGHYRKVQDAINSISKKNNQRIVVYIKAGKYVEQVTVKMDKITFLGAGRGRTVIANTLSYAKGYSTWASCTVCVTGNQFVARSLTIQNSSGREMLMAVAFRSDSDKSAFYNVDFFGNQDTVFIHSGRHYFRNCFFSGTVDFIFGQGSAVFQSCFIQVAIPSRGQQSTVTAQGRRSPYENSAFVFLGCKVVGKKRTKGNAFLGRPWTAYARTIWINSYLSSNLRRSLVLCWGWCCDWGWGRLLLLLLLLAGLGLTINGNGWLSWNGDTYASKPYLAEYRSSGPGARGRRARWVKPRSLRTASEVRRWLPNNVIQGNAWVASLGVPYKSYTLHARVAVLCCAVAPGARGGAVAPGARGGALAQERSGSSWSREPGGESCRVR
eukprot:jgi/Mesen1/10600/ME000086S10135